MRYFILVCLVSFIALSCKQSNKSRKIQGVNVATVTQVDTPPPPPPAGPRDTSVKQPAPSSPKLDFLRAMDGKYPNDVKLFEKTAFTDRLKKLLGDRYKFLKDTWAVENPIEVKNDVFVAWGCEQHNCGSTNFIIVVDLSKNAMYAGIREEEKVTRFYEGPIAPAELQKWANGQ